jgi:hypothetical protein
MRSYVILALPAWESAAKPPVLTANGNSREHRYGREAIIHALNIWLAG